MKGMKKYRNAWRKERSRNFLGENQELSVVPSGVTNSSIGINARVFGDVETLKDIPRILGRLSD